MNYGIGSEWINFRCFPIKTFMSWPRGLEMAFQESGETAARRARDYG